MDTSLETILVSCRSAVGSVDPASREALVEGIQKGRKIFVYGSGRSGLVGQLFAVRLVQLGYDVHFVGEMTTPIIGKEADRQEDRVPHHMRDRNPRQSAHQRLRRLSGYGCPAGRRAQEGRTAGNRLRGRHASVLRLHNQRAHVPYGQHRGGHEEKARHLGLSIIRTSRRRPS